jgi:hypothetical protein
VAWVWHSSNAYMTARTVISAIQGDVYTFLPTASPFKILRKQHIIQVVDG